NQRSQSLSWCHHFSSFSPSQSADRFRESASFSACAVLIEGALCSKARQFGQDASPKPTTLPPLAGMIMTIPTRSGALHRRTIIKAATAAGLAQFAAPFVIAARAADEIKLRLDDPVTGTYAELGKNEPLGCQPALGRVNANGG